MRVESHLQSSGKEEHGEIEEPSPSYDTYESSSIYGSKRKKRSAPQPHQGGSTSQPYSRRESSDDKSTLGTSSENSLARGSTSSSIILCTKEDQDKDVPLNSLSSEKTHKTLLSDSSIGYHSYDRRATSAKRYSLSNTYDRLHRSNSHHKKDLDSFKDRFQDFTLTDAGRQKSSVDSFLPRYKKYSDDMPPPFDPGFISYNEEGPKKHKKKNGRTKSVVEDLVVTNHVCSCDILGGKRHIHKIENNKNIGVPCMKSDSLTDSDLELNHERMKCSRRWCLCLAMVILFASLGAAVGIYIAYQFLAFDFPHERVFRGVLRVEGPFWAEDFENRTSILYRATIQEYKEKLNNIYRSSVLKVAFIRAEVLWLERGEDDTLVVHFNLHTNQQLNVEAKDLRGIFLLEIQRANSTVLSGLNIQKDSLEIQERSYPENQHATGSILSENNPKNHPHQKELMMTSSSTTSTPPPRTCTELNLKLCSTLHHNVTTYPNIFGHENLEDIEGDIIPIREVIDSECHPLAFEFLCEVLQPDCRKYNQPTPMGTFEDELVFPCQDFCEGVMAKCGARLPRRLRDVLKCDQFPLMKESKGACTAKPGCTRELRVKGWPDRVCDGVVDCEDMSDEDQCSNCTPDGFRCGPGVQCISQKRRCDGIPDCINKADERGCLSLTPTPTDRDAAKGDRWIKYNREGLLRYTEAGIPYRVCVDNINKTLSTPEAHQLIHNMAEVTCENLTFGEVSLVEVVTEDVFDHVPGLGYVQISDVFTRNITFQPVNCTRRTVVFISCAEPACGERPLYNSQADSIVERVVRNAGSGDWPWIAALHKDGVHTCDATLVHPMWLVTTSICFQGQGRASWYAHMGTTRISSQAPWKQERLIVGMVKSDVPTSKIVLIKLEKEVQLSDYVRPACLGSHSTLADLSKRKCRTLGWGARLDPLVELSVNVDPNGCDHFHPELKGPSFCARQISSIDRCLLEEMNGSGIICEWADRWEVVGVATSRTGCVNGAHPRYYEEVDTKTVKWIKKTIAAFERGL